MSKSWRTALAVGVIVAVLAATSAGAAKFITGGDIKNGSIGLKDLSKAAKRGLKGRTGPAGAVGPQGPAGPQGPSSLSTTITSGVFSALPQEFADGEVRCPAGMTATGGSLSPGALIPVFDGPSGDGGGWVGSAYNADTSATYRMLIVVICTPGSGQLAPTAVHDRAELKADARAEHGS